jgi:ribosomal protein L40E
MLPTRGRICLTCDAEKGASQLSPEIYSLTARDPFPETVPRWACPRRSGILTWALLLTLPSVAFMLILAQAGAAHLALATLCVYLCATTFAALAAFSDPGTIAPNRDPDIRRAVQLSAPVEVTVRGVSIQLKHCATCGIHRPPRAVHCRETNRCVRKWDHYCPWYVGHTVPLLAFSASGFILISPARNHHYRHPSHFVQDWQFCRRGQLCPFSS